MNIKVLNPRKALNKAYLKVKPNRSDIETFKTNLITLLDRINDTESEEFHKNLISDFLKDSYYKQNHFINTKGRNDLVIHNGHTATSTVGVIIETKKPTNKGEMVSSNKMNTKAFQELVLYYLRERITHKNLEIKHLIASNIYEWYIFDVNTFDRLFAQNKSFVKQFTDFEEGRLAETKTDFFYKNIAEPFIESIPGDIECTYFNLQDFQKPLRNEDKTDDNALIALFKLLSPEHLLKLPFANDSNSLDKRFYAELLHIIGLTESKEGSKKVIGRNKAGERHSGTILENAIIQLDSIDKINRLPNPLQYGSTDDERLYNVALELTITWVNRILFLKLLEAQLITYHKGDKSYAFLNIDKITNYDDLNSLFFQVLARRHDKRIDDVKKLFDKVPYLNSSLFEPTDMEQNTIFISNLKDDKAIPIHSQTVLKDTKGNKKTGALSALQYLFQFLDAYDFGAEGAEEIQEDNKTLINASVLGLIFEKINGYKDGSFFTPGFITMYMCRETIRKAVVQKFNDALQTPLLRGAGGVLLNHPTAGGMLLNNANTGDVSQNHPTTGGVLLNHPTAGGVLLNQPTAGGMLLNNTNTGDVSQNHPTTVGLSQNNTNSDSISIDKNHKKRSNSRKRRDIIPYNPKLKELARELRNNSTKSEIILWKELKGKFEGKYDFHRQKPLDNYIVDFFCHELKLAIEIDGETHNWEETQKKDFEKECRLNDLGVNVLRFSDTEVLKSLDALLETIRKYIHGYERGDLSEFNYEDTPLNPLSRGEFAVGKPHNTNDNIPQFHTLDDIYNAIGDEGIFTRQQANAIVNSITICDPAVGSGHFLVSALNEIIAIKHDLKILQDRNGKRLREYHLEVVNDELIVTDEDGGLFEYNPKNKESQRVQETLFHEKQTIIENCLFGVDINPNSVKICRLRLWIELLKNAYYKNDTELETLPNIDINIKCGNSLVSRFSIDADLREALKKSKFTIQSYRLAVAQYRNAKTKEEKRELERLITTIKSDFKTEIANNDPKLKKLKKLSAELYLLTNQGQLFDMNKKEKAEWNKKVKQLTDQTTKLEKEIEEIKSNKIFENAFEWRFEFPEVLNDEGDFVGFDVVIGNPPYGMIQNHTDYFTSVYHTMEGRFDLFEAFIEKALMIVKNKAVVKYILPNTLLTNLYSKKVRKNMLDNYNIFELTNFGMDVFEEATVHTCIIGIQNSSGKGFTKIRKQIWSKEELELDAEKVNLDEFIDKTTLAINITLSNSEINLFSKLSEHKVLSEICFIRQCIKTGDDKKYVLKSETILGEPWKKSLRGKGIDRYRIVEEDLYLKYGNFLARNWQNKSFYETPKIAIRETGNRIIAALDLENRYFLSTLYAIYPKTEFTLDYLKYLLGILNSKLATFFIKKIAFDLTEGAFTKVRTNQLGRLPIPAYDKKISLLVDKILLEKQEGKDTTDLENQIDQLVYQLYELTEEEIAIIEHSTK